jgi:hypothetical protein
MVIKWPFNTILRFPCYWEWLLVDLILSSLFLKKFNPTSKDLNPIGFGTLPKELGGITIWTPWSNGRMVDKLSFDIQIEIINNKARHNLMDAKCRWHSQRLDGAESLWEPLGQTKVMQICQGETQSHQGAITHEFCCLAAQLCRFLGDP